ncbi:coiled-coil domain-containing protein 93 isoform X2 [Tripterygium wilfordii]|uniref:coiled-coil domain-containing protein 93 isoform X2 n=1 Tax=Tripterygium wilfordii TaxID=458696 RepID=UPI0018F81E83|nr:coiled-coil domain-containing protein 93 isoform X2 [Tripterygium wilfordii]
MAESDSTSKLQTILHLLESAGFDDVGGSDFSVSDKITRGLSWCVAANSPLDAVSTETSAHLDKIENSERIEEALSSLRCPHPLRASQIENVDCEAILPVLRWLLSNCTQNERKIRNELQKLRDRINDAGASTMVEKLISLMGSLQVLERLELDCNSDTECSKLQAEVIELEDLVATGSDRGSFSDVLNRSLQESFGNLSLAKKELAAELKAVLSLKRQLDDVPIQSELIQYEHRFAELYVHIQDKHRQTQKYYATYNTLLEIKELMLKEISLLNSISSQFRDAITTAAGRLKLIDSMEGIAKSSQQKLEKVQRRLQEEQVVCDALKVRYSAAIAEQRQCSPLLKTFQAKLTN